MHPKITSHAAVLNLNKRLFENCMADVDEKTGQKRPDKQTNNMAFLAIHLVDARYFLARMLGAEAAWSVSKKLEEVNRVEDLKEYPTMEEILDSWQEVSKTLAERFSIITEKDLEKKSPQEFPLDDPSVLGGIAFLLEHESFHIGQLAFMRKFFGLPAMQYA